MIINHFTKSIFRVPVFSFDFLENVFNAKDDSWINDILKDDTFMHGLLIASYEFYNEVINYDDVESEEKKEKIKLTLLKYVIRSATRCIPFGVFSGLGVIENSTKINNQDRITVNFLSQNTRFDAVFLHNLVSNLREQQIIKENLIYYINSSLYTISNKCRYFEVINDYKSGIINFEFSEIDNNYYLDKIIDFTKDGGLYENLIYKLKEDGLAFNEAKNFIDSLIENNILLSELELSSLNDMNKSNEENICNVLYRVFKKTKSKVVYSYFKNLSSDIEIFKNTMPLPINDSYRIIENQICNLKDNFESFPNNSFLNKELFFETENVLGINTIKTVKRAANIYNKLLYGNKVIVKKRLDYFKDEFIKRYEKEFIPLSIVLDIETGIGYDSSFNSAGIDDSPLIKNFPTNSDIKIDDIRWSIFDDYIVGKIDNSNSKGLKHIELEDSDVKKFSELNPKDIENKIGSVRFSLFENNSEQLIYLQYLSYSSPNTIFERFTSGNEKINKLSMEIIEFEKENDIIYAEIDHVPNVKMMNFLNRNLFDEFKISYLGGNDNSDKKIKLEDLYVSIVDNEVVLYSRKLKKKIIPKFSTAFNYDYPFTLPLFKFLIDLHLQYEETEVGYFPVNKYHNFFKHIPRIGYKNIIFSRESWLVSYKDFYTSKEENIIIAIRNFSKNKNILNLPKYFIIIDDDIEFLINSENNNTIKIFLLELKKKKKLHIEEFLLENYESIIKNGDNENINNEFFLPIKLSSKSGGIALKSSAFKKNKIKRTFIPGDEWIYFKIYLGSKTADDFLLESYKLFQSLIRNKIISKLFYLKFNDPNNHIRIRLLLNSTESYNDTLLSFKKIVNKYTNKKLVYDFQIGTYQRELERYGLENIELIESIFHIDSDISIEILKFITRSKIENKKWLFALVIINIYFKSFELNIIQSIDILEEIIINLGTELKTNSSTTKFFNENYKKSKIEIEYYLNNYMEIKEIPFVGFSSMLCERVLKLNERENQKKPDYLPHFIHLHFTRIFGTQYNKIYEYNLYNFYLKFLKEKFYTSEIKFNNK